MVPSVIRKWNWGAAVFQGLWAAANLPMNSFSRILDNEGYGPWEKQVNLYGSLARRGNELSWKYKRWPSLKVFLHTQRRWEAAALTLLSLFCIAFAIAAFAGLYILIRR